MTSCISTKIRAMLFEGNRVYNCVIVIRYLRRIDNMYLGHLRNEMPLNYLERVNICVVIALHYYAQHSLKKEIA